METNGNHKQNGRELKPLNRFLLIVSYFVLFCSCKSERHKEIEYFLAGDKQKYWRLDSIDSPREFCYYRDYTYERFYFNQKLKTRHEYGNPYGDDVRIGPDTWGIINDSTIYMNSSIVFLIKKLTETQIVLYNETTNGKEVLFLYKSPEQETPVTRSP